MAFACDYAIWGCTQIRNRYINIKPSISDFMILDSSVLVCAIGCPFMLTSPPNVFMNV